MRPDQDVDPALLEVAHRCRNRLRRPEPRRHLDPQRVVAEALRERAEVLLGEDRRGDQEHHLLAIGRRLERGAEGDLGLAVPHVAADQAVHRPRLLHVRLHLVDGLELIGRLLVREGALEVDLPVGVLRKPVPGATAALGVQVDQLAGERLRRPPGAQLHLLPLLAAELRERRVRRVGSDVAADLVELVARHEDPVAAAVLELQVVPRDPADRLRLEAREAGDPVVLVHHGVARAEVGERRNRRGARARPRRAALRPAPPEQAVLGEDGQLQGRREESLPQARGGERQAGLLRRRLAVEEGGAHAREVVGGPLGLAASAPRHDRAVAGADELLELRLRLPQVARRRVGPLRAELVRLIARDARKPEGRALVEHRADAIRGDVEMVGVRVVEARGHVLPQVRQRRIELLLGGDRDHGLSRDQGQQLAEPVDGEKLGHVRALGGVLVGGYFGQLAMLRADLGAGSDLHPLCLFQRPLREGREEGQPLHLHVEQLASHGALLGGRVDVEDVPADGELAAVLDLVDALVAAGHQPARGLVEVDQPAALEGEAVRPQLGIGDLLAQGRRGRDHDGRALVGRVVQQRVERGDPQPHEVRRRRQVGLVLHASGGIEADQARGQEGLEVGGEVASRPVVARHHQGGPVRLGVEQRRQQVRTHALGDERPLARPGHGGARQRGDLRVVMGVGEQRAEGHGHAKGPRTRARPSAIQSRYSPAELSRASRTRGCSARRRPSRSAPAPCQFRARRACGRGHRARAASTPR